MIAAAEKLTLETVRLDPAGNITVLVTDPVPPELRSAAAAAIMARSDAEQVGFLAQPVLGGLARLEMMGGEFCGNALRSLGLWYARTHLGVSPERLLLEISGCQSPMEAFVEPTEGFVRAAMPLPLSLETWEGLPTAVFPGIVHVLCRDMAPSRDHAGALTAAAAGYFSVPAAGVMYLSGLSMRPAVYVRDTDSLVFESSCASGSAAVAALLSAEERVSGTYELRQPGGIITAAAERRFGRLTALTISGTVSMDPPVITEIRPD